MEISTRHDKPRLGYWSNFETEDLSEAPTDKAPMLLCAYLPKWFGNHAKSENQSDIFKGFMPTNPYRESQH